MSDLAREFGEVLQSWLRAQDPATVAAIQAAFVTGWKSGRTVESTFEQLAANVTGAGAAVTLIQWSVVPQNRAPNGTLYVKAFAQVQVQAPTLTAALQTLFTLTLADLTSGLSVSGNSYETWGVGESGGYKTFNIQSPPLEPAAGDNLQVTLAASVLPTGFIVVAGGNTWAEFHPISE